MYVYIYNMIEQHTAAAAAVAALASRPAGRAAPRPGRPGAQPARPDGAPLLLPLLLQLYVVIWHYIYIYTYMCICIYILYYIFLSYIHIYIYIYIYQIRICSYIQTFTLNLIEARKITICYTTHTQNTKWHSQKYICSQTSIIQKNYTLIRVRVFSLFV